MSGSQRESRGGSGNENISSTWDKIKDMKKKITKDSDLGVFWERFKKALITLLQELYEFIQKYSNVHMFSLLMFAIWICIIVMVKIPRNWDTHWHHLYYFGMVIFMGLVLFRYDMENEVEDRLNNKGKIVKSNDTENIDYDGLEYNRKFYYNIREIKKKLELIIKTIENKEKNGEKITCDNVKSLIDTTNNKLRELEGEKTIDKNNSIYENIEQHLDEHLDDIEDKSGCVLSGDNSRDVEEGKQEETKELIKKFKEYIDTISTEDSKGKLEKLALESVQRKEKEEAKKLSTRKLPETLGEQIKVYFKYLALTACVVFLMYLLFLIYDGSGKTMRHGMHVMVGCLLIGLFLFFMYMISSKRQYLKVAWNKTDSSIKNIENQKIKENNKGENRGFFFLRLFTRPFVVMFYFLYGMMCSIRDFLKDMRDPQKRALSQKRFKKWKEQYLGYIVVIVGGLTFLFIQYILPNLHRINISLNSTILLKNPVYLDKLKVIATDEKLNRHAGDNNGRDFSFSLSAWIYIENSNANHNFSSNMNATILNYGELPHLTYNVRTNTTTIFVKKGKDVKHVVYQTTQLKKQKWNQVVFNYDHGVMDVFINGELVSTTTGIIPYMTNDDIYVGQAQGIRGGIKDVVYSHVPRSKLEIEKAYYLSKVQSYLML